MEQNIREMLSSSGEEVFGTMYFMSIQLLDEVPNESSWHLDSSYITASIDFSGPKSASIKYFFPDSMARNIVAGFIGLDTQEVSEKQLLDTMQEAANMMTGSLLGKLDPDGSCKLSIPVAELLEEFSPKKLSNEAEVFVFNSDFGYLWMTYA